MTSNAFSTQTDPPTHRTSSPFRPAAISLFLAFHSEFVTSLLHVTVEKKANKRDNAPRSYEKKKIVASLRDGKPAKNVKTNFNCSQYA